MKKMEERGEGEKGGQRVGMWEGERGWEEWQKEKRGKEKRDEMTYQNTAKIASKIQESIGKDIRKIRRRRIRITRLSKEDEAKGIAARNEARVPFNKSGPRVCNFVPTLFHSFLLLSTLINATQCVVSRKGISLAHVKGNLSFSSWRKRKVRCLKWKF